MKYLTKDIKMTMNDGSIWKVPVLVVALHRASYFARREYDGNIIDAMMDDTVPLFNVDHREIYDWAVNNMNWANVVKYASKIKESEKERDYQEEWVNGEKEIE